MAAEERKCPECGHEFTENDILRDQHGDIIDVFCPLAPAHARIKADAEKIKDRDEVIGKLVRALEKIKTLTNYCAFTGHKIADEALTAAEALDKKEEPK